MKHLDFVEFQVEVFGEGGCEVPELGGNFKNYADAEKHLRNLTRQEAEAAGAFSQKNGTGVNAHILVVGKDDEEDEDSAEYSIILSEDRWL